jgi:hypothetical protein
MRSIIQAVAAIGALFLCVGAAAPPRIDYELTPILENGVLQAVQFDLTFRGESDGQSDLRLPDSWGGQNELWRSVEALEVVSGATMRDGEEPNQRLLTHRPNARIHIRYRIIQDWEGVPRAELGNTYRATIQPTYFHLIGNAVLVTPGGTGLNAPVRLRVRDLPREWTFASDLLNPHLTLEKIWSSVIVAGDFRILHDPNSNVQLAIRGEWSFTDQQLLTQAADIIAGHRRFWSDRRDALPRHRAAISHGPEGWVSVGGTGLDDAFAFFATPNAEQDDHHAPRSRTRASTPGSPAGRRPPAGRSSPRNTGSRKASPITTPPACLCAAGCGLRRNTWPISTNALRRITRSRRSATAPNAQISLLNFWSDRERRSGMPYIRGRFLAMIWHARLRQQRSAASMIVVHDMRAAPGQGAQYAQSKSSSPISGGGFRLDLVLRHRETYVDQGRADPVCPKIVLAPCGRVTTREAPLFHRGFDIEATQANNDVVAGVDPYASRVRGGSARWHGARPPRRAARSATADLEIAYVVRDGDTERTFRYMPRGHGYVHDFSVWSWQPER